MRQVLVYDAPARVFHWLFAGFFVTAFAISNLVDDESARFAWHMLAGLGMVFVVGLRLLWSLVGTRHARLSDLALNPAQLLAYFKGMFSGLAFALPFPEAQKTRHWRVSWITCR